ncbi:hypothetical protein Phum_PHUM463360 [Pediculus humanus corporis]|uniref:Uncharacterized protein n=1 Tax=Pediculus humanus subsp. corporis TaxID=121224 RepID=E0VVH3_PEDHC|nr:uncharacterized protein Phum_PHUM463360 [Pediculus humanus corporis]EEB17379.1 hypothetical protein Phum_PHUM463360 [Pediculus humanus corporis]
MSKSGEIAQEFTKLIGNFKAELEKLKEAEELASKELIEKIKCEEENKYEELKKKSLQQIEEDEKLAYMVQEELKNVSPKKI